MADFKIANPYTQTTHKVILGPDGNPVSYVEEQKMPSEQLAFAREKSEAEHNKHRPNTQTHFRHIGRIPATIHAELKRRGITEDKVKMMRWLEENRHFLVTAKDKI